MKKNSIPLVLLFDFYGDLLTERQRVCFDLYHNEDLSLSEIAESEGISRQGVRDNLMRAERALTEFEEKTGLVSRFQIHRGDADRLETMAQRLRAAGGENASMADEMERIARRLRE